MDLEKIQKLIEMVNNSGLSEFKLEEDGMKIKLVADRRQMIDDRIVMGNVPVNPEAEQQIAVSCQPSADYCYITSPLVGVFKSLSVSDKTPIKVGDRLEIGQPVCVVEAMKLINEIESDKVGEVVEIMVSEGEAVEFGQELIKIKV